MPRRRYVLQRPAVHGHQADHGTSGRRRGLPGQADGSRGGAQGGVTMGGGCNDHTTARAQEAGVS